MNVDTQGHIKIHDVVQGSNEWFAVRKGVITASGFAHVMAKGGGKTRTSYLERLATEIVTGQRVATFQNEHTRRGVELEPEARAWYAMQYDCDPEIVGFVYNEKLKLGCSPDAYVGDRKILEIKTKLPELVTACLRRQEVPPAHMAQCQGNLWICEREVLDFLAYWPGMPPAKITVVRNEVYIRRMAVEIERFREDLNKTVKQLKK
jgi:putative phage-type endonuclease